MKYTSFYKQGDTSSWDCAICSRENPGYAMFCQNSKCKAVQGSWKCETCGHKVSSVDGVLLPAKIECCPNCGQQHK